jgi:hypothetical protein
MPLYNKKSIYGREAAKPKETTPLATPTSTLNEYGTGIMTFPVIPKIQEAPLHHQPVYQAYGYTEESNASSKSETSVSGYGFTAGYTMTGNSTEGMTTFPSSFPDTSSDVPQSGNTNDTYMPNSTIPLPSSEPEPTKPVVEKETPTSGSGSAGTGTGTGALPDDLQHALDLIYAGTGAKPAPGPISFPPPKIVPPPVAPAPVPVPPPATTSYGKHHSTFNSHIDGLNTKTKYIVLVFIIFVSIP